MTPRLILRTAALGRAPIEDSRHELEGLPGKWDDVALPKAVRFSVAGARLLTRLSSQSPSYICQIVVKRGIGIIRVIQIDISGVVDPKC